MSFVGERRRALVGDLMAEFEGVEFERTPSLVSLESPAGWGKTRVLRQFYADLARSQPESRQYCPIQPPADRDPVDPGCVTVGGGVELPWLWSGVQCLPGLS